MFETSTTTEKLDAALAKAQGEIKAAAKDSINPHFRSKYADLASVWDAARGALAKNGISVTQWPVQDEAKLTIVTRVACAGEWLKGTFSIPVAKHDAQGYGSAITYARRFTLMAALGIAPDDQSDDDGEAAVGRPQDAAVKPSQTRTVAPQSISKAAPSPKAQNSSGPSEAQIKRMWAIASACQLDEQTLKTYCKETWGLASSKEMTLAQYDQLCRAMEAGEIHPL